MSKLSLNKPLLILLYGFPGSGKSYFAKQFSESLGAVHLYDDKIRSNLFSNPRYSKEENEVVAHIMDYMTEEFLKGGTTIIYDKDTSRNAERKEAKALAERAHAKTLVIWLQIDTESAFARLRNRDRRKQQDKIARPYTRSEFDDYLKNMQNPISENYVVISGKHSFQTQKNSVIKKLYEMGYVSTENVVEANVAMPGLINLVPKLQSSPQSPRNIVIR